MSITAPWGRERGVGVARDLEGDVGDKVVEAGDIDGAEIFELGARKGGDRDRHVEQPLLAPPRGDDDLFDRCAES